MGKGNGSAGRAGGGRANSGPTDMERLSQSSDWGIRTGMGALERAKENGVDMSDMSNLNEEEKTYVSAYLAQAYPTVNRTLRGEIENNDARLLAGKIDRALSKLKNYEGEVYRGESFTPGYGGLTRKTAEQALNARLDEMRGLIGKEYAPKSLTSTGSQKNLITRKFASDKSYSITYTIKSKTGKDLRRYNSEEREVLFRANTRFRVLSVRGHNVKLEEI